MHSRILKLGRGLYFYRAIPSSGCNQCVYVNGKNTPNGCSTIVTVTVDQQAVTSAESISQVQAYPNLVKEKSKLKFKLENVKAYVVNLYDLKGILIRQLSAGHARAGKSQNFILWLIPLVLLACGIQAKLTTPYYLLSLMLHRPKTFI